MNNFLKFTFFIFSFAIFCNLTACTKMLDDAGLYDATLLPPAEPVDFKPPPKENGTIYQAGHEISLYQDRIARRIGDILTVRLEETTQGEKNAHTKTDKISSINTNAGNNSNPTLFGRPFSELIFDTGSELEFDGKGHTNQSNKLQGTISVTVTRVLSNKNLMIQGESWVVINQGREYIRLTGIVRPEDIEANNTISSQRVTNARVTYSGGGQVANSSRGGLMTQLFFKFFPY